MDELQYKLLDKVNVSERLGRFGKIIPVFILIVTAVISVMVVREYYNDAAELRKRLLIENQLKMASTLDHVEEFLSSIYYDLLFISLDPDVKAMNRKSYPHIKALIDHEWETNKLSEVYVIEALVTRRGLVKLIGRGRLSLLIIEEVVSQMEEIDILNVELEAKLLKAGTLEVADDSSA